MERLKDLERLVCNISHVQLSKEISFDGLEALRSNMEIISHVSEIRRSMMLSLVSALPALLDERIIIHRSWPANWWEAVKERFAPQWFKSRWPVKLLKVDIDRPVYKSVCPHIDVRFRDNPVVHFDYLRNS
jgi:hypothetical protein